MPDFINEKQAVYNKLMQIINERINSARLAIASAKEARDNETKSSVGDKYETGRAMMQMELEKNRVQLTKTLSLKNELDQINLNKKCDKVEFGSLVITSNGNYFITIGIGKIRIDNKVYYSISLASPIGKAMQNKKEKERFNFQGKEITIIDIW